MPKRKLTFGLRIYPYITYQFDMYINSMGRSFIKEIHPLLSWVSEESISEGDYETIERLDGSRVTMGFNEADVSIILNNDTAIYGNFDELIAIIYDISREMGNKMVQNMLATIYNTAEEYGNLYNSKELNVETVCEMLEKSELTFDDNGVMNNAFVIPPELEKQMKTIVLDSRVQEIVERKRREYFAKKSD